MTLIKVCSELGVGSVFKNKVDKKNNPQKAKNDNEISYVIGVQSKQNRVLTASYSYAVLRI